FGCRWHSQLWQVLNFKPSSGAECGAGGGEAGRDQGAPVGETGPVGNPGYTRFVVAENWRCGDRSEVGAGGCHQAGEPGAGRVGPYFARLASGELPGPHTKLLWDRRAGVGGRCLFVTGGDRKTTRLSSPGRRS